MTNGQYTSTWESFHKHYTLTAHGNAHMPFISLPYALRMGSVSPLFLPQKTPTGSRDLRLAGRLRF